LAIGPTVEGGISGIEQGSRFGITTRNHFLVSEKHQKIRIVIGLPACLCQSVSDSCGAEAVEGDRGFLRGARWVVPL
jgi:hypothetical protein